MDYYDEYDRRPGSTHGGQTYDHTRGSSQFGSELDGDEQDHDDEGSMEPVDHNNESEMDSNPSGPSTPAGAGSSKGFTINLRKESFVKPKAKSVKAAKGRPSGRKVATSSTPAVYVDEEIVLETDLRGELKIDADGNLADGREFIVNTFTSPFRPRATKLYMLSIDVARAAGNRDSLYFFRKHPNVVKHSCSKAEKDWLIGLGKLIASSRTRPVTMVAAASVFRVLGATIIKDGRYVFDDYYETKALELHKPGDSAYIAPYDKAQDAAATAAPKINTTHAVNTLLGQSSGKILRPEAGNALRDDSGTGISSSSISTFGGTGIQPFGKKYDASGKKARPALNLTRENWMIEYAMNVAEANRDFARVRSGLLGEVKLGREEGEEECYIQGAEYGPGEEAAERREAKRARAVKMNRTEHGDQGDEEEEDDDDDEDEDDDEEVNGGGLAKSAKRRKIHNPIRGVIDPETNSALVYRDTQTNRAVLEKLSDLPQIKWEGTSLWHESNPLRDGVIESREMMMRMRTAKKLGVASFEIVAQDNLVELNRVELLAGMWDFRSVSQL